MVADLKKKLLGVKKLTQFCGTTQKVQSNEASDFRKKIERYTDSANEVKRCK